MSPWIPLIGGFVVLGVGAELLVRTASRLARGLGVSALVVGLTVVAFGTSAPELVVSVLAAAEGQADLAFGNVVGSNILNVLLILGASAAIVPLVVAPRLVRFDLPVLVVAVGAVTVLGRDGRVGRLEGALLAACLFAYLGACVRLARRDPGSVLVDAVPEGSPRRSRAGLAWDALGVLFGLGLLVLGSDWFVAGAVELARSLGVSELVVGLTLVALGTSLPEVATSLLAAVRGEREIAVGNVIGSCIFNSLGVVGFAGAVSAQGLPVPAAALSFDVPVMIATTLVCLPICGSGLSIARWEGWLLLGLYVAYTATLVLVATEHAFAGAARGLLLYLALPGTLVALTAHAWRAREDAGERRS